MDEALSQYIVNRERVIAQVKQILIGTLKVRRTPESIDLDAALFGSGLGLDSVDALELVIALEASFHIAVEEQRFRTSLRTLNSLVDLILQLTTPAEAAA